MRARSLKPAIFKNELLATSDPLHTVIFEGLWCLADREGRMEDRPRRIHLEINPGRPFEGTEESLAFLAEHGFIVRYEVAGKAYIAIPRLHDFVGWDIPSPALERYTAAQRRAAKIQRTPLWADREAIRFFYECCPRGCHVDHIIPLRAEKASGLHVAENLQWLPATANARKGNRFTT